MKHERTFPVSHQDIQAAWAIAARAKLVYEQLGQEPPDARSVAMAIISISRFNPMRLAELLSAKIDDFAHDVAGIMKNYDPVTDQLKDGWTPRHTLSIPPHFNGHDSY